MKLIQIKKFFIDVIIIFLSFVSVFCFVQNDKKLYHNQLIHNGLSDNSIVYISHSNQNIQQTLEKFSQKHWNNYQIYFNLNKNVTYLYQKSFTNVLPIINGHFFKNTAFESQVPIVVVGRNLKDKLYMPTKQQYWENNNNYLSVIGIIGTENKSLSVNNHIFVSASPEGVYNDQPLSHFKIIVDGPGMQNHKRQIAKILNATSFYSFISQNTPLIGPTWIGTYGILSVLLIFILIIAILLTIKYLLIDIINFSVINLDNVMKWKIFWKLFRLYSINMIFSIFIGGIIGYMTLPIINMYRIINFGIFALIFLILVYSILFWLVIKKNLFNKFIKEKK